MYWKGNVGMLVARVPAGTDRPNQSGVSEKCSAAKSPTGSAPRDLEQFKMSQASTLAYQTCGVLLCLHRAHLFFGAVSLALQEQVRSQGPEVQLFSLRSILRLLRSVLPYGLKSFCFLREALAINLVALPVKLPPSIDGGKQPSVLSDVLRT